MLDIPKGKPMATDEQKAACKPAVEKGAEIFAALEGSAAKDKARAETLVGIYEAIRDAGVISAFECRAHSMETRAVALTHQADWDVLHNKLVRRCVELDIDVPPMDRDGGPR